MSDQTSAGDATAGPDPLVSLAFAMGWQMADLYRDPSSQAQVKPDDRGLPGAGSLPDGPRTELGIEQIQGGLHRLADRLSAAGAKAPSLDDVRAVFATGGADAVADELYRLHVQLITVLTAADFRLGKAYGVGRALSDTAHVTSPDDLKANWNAYRLNLLKEWLSDLDSALPPHAARGVGLSVARWEKWLGDHANPALGTVETGWTSLGEATRRRLVRQGRIWRSLLSAEKQGTDMLSTEHYVNAVGRALIHSRAIAINLVIKFREVVALAAALFVLGLVLALGSDDSARILAGIGAVVSALGVSWKTVGGGLVAIVKNLREPVWGGELDEAIGLAITSLPQPPRPEPRWYTRLVPKSERARRERARKEELDRRRRSSPAGPYESVDAPDGRPLERGSDA
jgi:hypothetical protein